MKIDFKTYFFLIFILTGCGHVHKNVQRNLSTAEISWPTYAGNLEAQKFSPARQINKTNIKNLKLAWKWESDDNKLLASIKMVPLYNESTPLMVGGVLYTMTSMNQVVALNAETGVKKWSLDTEAYKEGYPVNLGFVQRAPLYWDNGQGIKRLFVNTSNSQLMSIIVEPNNPKNGQLDTTFGQDGKVDLTLGLRRPVARNEMSHSSPPILCGKTLIVGSSIADLGAKFNLPPGDVRGFDPLSGKLKWTFKTIPQGKEFGSDSWKEKSNLYMGNTNVWTYMSADNDLNSVYLPVSTPSNDFYGGERKGSNLFAESLVSLNCDTGQRNWHYQIVHHGLWDYDLPAAPILMNLKRDDKIVKAVAQVTKQGFIFVFDRKSGKPIWPIAEKAVPLSDVPGEEVSKTQPFPTRPVPFADQGFLKNNVIDFSPEITEEALNYIAATKYKFGELYSPPSLEGTFMVPGAVGGASWAGAAFNPMNGKLYVPSIILPYVAKLVLAPPGSDTKYIRSLFSSIPQQPNGLPLTKPPYGKITAYEMAEGNFSWTRPMGRTTKKAVMAHPSMKNKAEPEGDLGDARRIHVLATPTLLFATQDGNAKVTGLQNNNLTLIWGIQDVDPSLQALDLETGEIIKEIPLEQNSYGAPMTYEVNGKQYIVMPYGGANKPSGYLAYSLTAD